MKDMNKKALELNPNLIEAELGRGLIEHFQGNFELAREIFDTITEHKNDFYPAWHWSGVASEILKDYEIAISKFKKAAHLKPYSEEPWVHIGQCYYNLGDFLSHEKAEDKMLEIIQRKLEINANDTIALSRMAATYGKRRHKKKALEIVAKLKDLAPTDGLVMYNCACTYAVMSLKKEALELLEKAMEKGYKNILEWVDQDRDFDPIREDEDFKRVIAKYTDE
jgi:adenylate cyclase